MKKSFAIIGLGRFGLSLIEELSKYTNDIIGIDTDMDAVKTASHIIEQAYQADSSSEKALRSIGVQNADHAVISFGENFEGTIMTYVTLKNLGIKDITVRCDKDNYVPILEKLGVKDIISPTKIAGAKLATRISAPDFVDYFELANDYCVVDLSVPNTFKGKKIFEIDARNKFDVNLLLIRRNNISINPKANDEILPGDELFVFGKSKNITELGNYLKQN